MTAITVIKIKELIKPPLSTFPGRTNKTDPIIVLVIANLVYIDEDYLNCISA